jgi:hypothetical protein
VSGMALPPVFAAGALYDSLLQAALHQFFGRATFETEPIPSVSSFGQLGIEPTGDPSALTIRWFGFRHILRVPERQPFTEHEVRLARAIGAVLAARYRAIFDPRLMAERGDLFQGSIEDRYVGAFLDDGGYRIEPTQTRADRIASAIEVLRVAALSSYENRPISSGVLLLEGDENPLAPSSPLPAVAASYSQHLTAIKSFYRLCDGTRTLFLVNRHGQLLDIVDVARWAAEAAPDRPLPVPCANAYRAHARATLASSRVSVVLSPSHEIKIFAEGAQIFTFRNAAWHLLDLHAKYRMWLEAVGNPLLAEPLFQAALDLSDAREGALFVVLRDPAALPQLVSEADRLDLPIEPDLPEGEFGLRRQLLALVRHRTITTLDPSLLEALARIDGATVSDTNGRLLAVGAILRIPAAAEGATDWAVEGARTAAALRACRFGPVLKVSEDGLISCYDQRKLWDI